MQSLLILALQFFYLRQYTLSIITLYKYLFGIVCCFYINNRVLQVSKMNNDLLKYLQQDSIGKVIAKGLADVYTHKPQAPVKYLAAWLKKYSSNQQVIAQLEDQHDIKSFNAELEHHTWVMNSTIELYGGKLKAFKSKVQKDDYQEELLSVALPQFIEDRFALTGAYVGYVNHPIKPVTEDDEEQNAHLDTAIPKLINYIGASVSHADLMLGKTLGLDKGVTAPALSLSLEDPQPAEDGTVEVREKYVYVGNVVKNENMHYFRLPKLGSYIALPLIYQSYLSQAIFNVALEGRLKYLGELEQFQKTKAEELKEFDNEIQASEQKLTEATEKNDEATIQATKTEIAELKKKRKEKQDQKLDPQQTELPTEKRQFLVCGDTLGQDREIPLNLRGEIVQIIKHFRDTWQKKERDLLYKDVDYQIKIQKNEQRTAEATIQHLHKLIEITAQNAAQYNQIEDEQLREYKKSSWQLETLKHQIKQVQHYLASFFKLKNFRVVKFKTLIQNLLYFLGHKKSDINLPGKTQLDWKKVRANHLYADTFFAIVNYNPEGPKTEDYPSYCKITHINEILQKFDEHEVYKYNVGLGSIQTLVKKQIAHRIANIELRRHQKQKEREHRAQLIEANDKITEQKNAALEKHKQSLPAQQVEAFKEEQWSAKYDEQNPLKEIPAEVVDDIDNDL